MSETTFNRGLSPAFVHELESGGLAGIVAETFRRDLDIQIREDYINVYHDGTSILKLAERKRLGEYRAFIHRKYLQDVALPDQLHGQKSYAEFAATRPFINDWLRKLPAIIRNAARYASEEAKVEQQIIAAGGEPSSPVIFIDRQVQVHGVRKRADLLALSSAAECSRLYLVELKRGLDNRIQLLIDQITNYYRIIADAEGRLRDEFLRSYQKVVQQKRRLGLLPESVSFPRNAPLVDCLLILYDYNARSKLLSRLQDAAADSRLKPYLVVMEKESFKLPPIEEWERL